MSKSTNSVILGTAIGTAVGFLAGILLAPASGKETRQNIADKADDIKESISDAANKAISSLNKAREEVAKN